MKLTKAGWISFGLAIVLGAVIFGSLQFNVRGYFADPDGFYHARASQLLVAGELHDTFPWLYFTTWRDHYANQHYLYHWLLVPFNTAEKLPISIVVFGLFFVTAFLAALAQYKISFKPFWIFLLLTSSVDFLFRINLVKANTISLALLCLIAILVYWHDSHKSHKARYAFLGIGLVSAVFVWIYGGFVCVPLLLGAYLVSKILTEHSLKWAVIKTASAPLFASLVGIALGIALHPQYNNLLVLLFDQLFRTGLGAGTVVPAGNEWQPFDLAWFVKSNILLLFVWLFGVALVMRTGLKKNLPSTLTTWLQITAFGLMALTLWHRRFVEYWVPFAVLAAAVTVQPYLQRITWGSFKKAVKMWQVQVAGAAIIILATGIAAYNIKTTAQSLRGGESSTAYEAVAEWVRDNSEVGDIVFNTQWDQFPQMFYYNDKNYYLVGLDPTFMYINDSEKYWLWRKIADDNPEDWESIEQVYRIISADLQAKFILIDKNRNSDLYEYLFTPEVARYFFLIYEDEQIVVFEAK